MPVTQLPVKFSCLLSIIHKFHPELGRDFAHAAVGRVRAIDMIDGREGFDRVGPIDGLAVDDGGLAREVALPVVPVYVRPVDAAAGPAFYARPIRRVNLGHDRVGPITEFLIRERGMIADNGKGSVREELGGPIGANVGAVLPGQPRAVGADPGLAAFPFRLGIPDETIGAMVEDVVGDGNFAGDILAVGTVVTHDENAVGVSDVDQGAGELGRAVAAVEKRVAGGGFDDDVTNALAFVPEHQAGFVGDAGDVAAEVVGRGAHVVNPVAFAEVPGVNAPVADLAATGALTPG